MYEQTVLPNGLRLITAAMPHTRSAAVQIYLRAGARMEPPDKSGISHFVEHMVFKGTVARPHPAQISEAIEGVGGAMNATTNHEHTNYRALVPSSHMATALDVLTDMLRGSLFDRREVKKERAVIIEEINSTFDSPPDIADMEFDHLLWGDHPLGRDIAGSRQTVRRIKREDLLAHVDAHYRPDATVISVAGNIEHAQVLAEVERLWGDLPATNGVAHDHESAPPQPAAEPGPHVTVYRKETEQSNVLVGVPALPYTDPGRYVQDVLDTILGGGMSSRLFVAIREELGLAYHVSSFLKTYSDVASIGVHAAVDNERVEPTLEATLVELDKVRQHYVSETELRKVKEYIKGHTLIGLERTGYVAQWAGWQQTMMGRIESVEDALERIEAISAAEILSLAQRLFSSEKLYLALVGPSGRRAGLRRVLERGLQ